MVTKGSTTVGVTYGRAPATAWVLYDGLDPVNVDTIPPTWSATLAMNARLQACENKSLAGPIQVEPVCLRQLGLRNVSVYVSDRQFWTLQLREGALLLLGTTLLLAAGLAVLRKRRA